MKIQHSQKLIKRQNKQQQKINHLIFQGPLLPLKKKNCIASLLSVLGVPHSCIFPSSHGIPFISISCAKSISSMPWEKEIKSSDCCFIVKSCPTLWDPMDCNTPGFQSFTISQSLLKLLSFDLVMLSNHFILCHHIQFSCSGVFDSATP